jgi:hypothetical protein
MHFNLYTDVKAFRRDTFDTLMRHEAQNLVPLGNVIIGYEGKDTTGWRKPENWFMAAVTNNGAVLLTALMTPPHNLTLYATDNIINDEAITVLIDGLSAHNVTLPGVMTESVLAEHFARMYSKAADVNYALDKSMRLYELLKVNYKLPPNLTLRLARDGDMAFLPYWIEGFNHECFGNPLTVNDDTEGYRYHIRKERLYVLEDNGTPVSIAQINRQMVTVCGVSLVYTPPYFRKRGYATAATAEISRAALGKGFERCALYTDLANPTSNSIYMKIGYVPVCDSSMYRFF